MKNRFEKALKKRKIPILVLDQKWHRLFQSTGKPEEIAQLENQLNQCLQRNGQINDEIKEYRYLKGKLLNSIVHNMDGTNEAKENSLQSKILEKDKELIDELNEKLEAHENEKKELPLEIEQVNMQLMLATMRFCDSKMRENSNEIQEISRWISSFRNELKKNVIRKRACEIGNKEMYTYFHSVFGMDLLQIFEIDYKEFDSLMDLKDPEEE